MHIRICFVGLIFFCSSLFAQNFSQQKDIVFGQVAAGGDYETVITISNRGTETYSGVLKFYRGQGEQWNPTVNGTPLTGGQRTINLGAGAMATYHVTASGLSAGFAYVTASSPAQTNFVEGSLTYFIRSGSNLVDSVGVPPSLEFYLSNLPFEDFSTIALALANADTGSKTAHVILNLISETNALVETKSFDLPPSWHTPQFLSQFFPGRVMGKGRIEIVSDVPILGTALTLMSGQFSSLPLLPSPRTYTFTASISGDNFNGDVSLWAEGPFVKGFFRVVQYNGSPVSAPPLPLFGRLINGALMVFTWGNGFPYASDEGSLYLKIAQFTFSMTSYTGNWVGTSMTAPDATQGTITLTKVN